MKDLDIDLDLEDEGDADLDIDDTVRVCPGEQQCRRDLGRDRRRGINR